MEGPATGKRIAGRSNVLDGPGRTGAKVFRLVEREGYIRSMDGYIHRYLLDNAIGELDIGIDGARARPDGGDGPYKVCK
jgi:hypothetical protein